MLSADTAHTYTIRLNVFFILRFSLVINKKEGLIVGEYEENKCDRMTTAFFLVFSFHTFLQ
jgi:hypothetical protein